MVNVAAIAGRSIVLDELTDTATWAQAELGGADLGDPRRSARLVRLATIVAEHPDASLPEACPTGSDLKGAYRFFANPSVAPERILARHVAATCQRLAEEPLVLAVQDTTLLDYTDHPQTEGLGPLGNPKTHGLVVHGTLTFTPERVPLGLLSLQVWTRDAVTYGKLPDHKRRPLAEKESRKWLSSVDAVAQAKRACPQTQFVCMGDREADIYELFVQDRPVGVDLLVRASWDRRVDADEGSLWAALEAGPNVGTVQVSVPRHGTRPARVATVQLRVRKLTLRPPARSNGTHLAPVALGAVLAREPTPPAGVEALEWLLLTTVPTTTLADAAQRLAWYACRWGIEVWHMTLKSGCRIEAKQLEDVAHLRRCLTVLAIVAWRIQFATMLARAAPDLPCSVWLGAAEWQALCCTIHKTPIPPAEPPSLRQAVRWVAQLGGFLGRARDGEPGVTTLWRGLVHLHDLTTMYTLMQTIPPKISVGNA